MRVLKFAKVDLIKSWKSLFFLLFPIITVFLLTRDPKMPAMFGVAYCLFVSIVLAAMPFNAEDPGEAGFLQMLPARPGEQVLGHFLFGLASNVCGFAVGLLCALVAHAINPASSLFSMDGMSVVGFYPALLGIALVFTGIESLVLTLFRFHNAHAMQLMRIVPAFVFFFAMNALAIDGKADFSRALVGVSGFGGAVALGVCLLVFSAMAWLGSQISVARGQS